MTESRPPRARQVPCARCGKPTLFTPENPFRPFCSERCKLIDLGNWADGRYAIPFGQESSSEKSDDEEAEREDRSSGQTANRSSNQHED